MAQADPKPKLPAWTWLDLEQALYSLAETPHQSMVARHFLTNLSQTTPTDSRSILLELMHITMVMHALPDGTAGIAQHRPQRLHG